MSDASEISEMESIGGNVEDLLPTETSPDPTSMEALGPTTEVSETGLGDSAPLESEWVIVKSIHCGDENNDGGVMPKIDVVHVTALCAYEDMYDLSTIIPDLSDTERRELIFRTDMSTLLVGDSTQASIELEATRLLRGIISQQSETPNERRSIIFVAYDLGSLVVKTALHILARFEDRYSTIYANNAPIIFSGCPQRASDSDAMSLKLLNLLHGKSEAWSHLITTSRLDNLSRSVLQTTQMLISSKVTLRSRIISLYSDEEQQGKIHSSLDCYTGTLGIPNEVTIKEQVGNDSEPAFPGLAGHASFQYKQWVPHPDWIPIERSLLSLSAPHRQLGLDPRHSSSLQPFLDTQVYKEWTKSAGPQILYIHGLDSKANHDVADLVFLTWQEEQRASGSLVPSRSLPFVFDSNDPLRNSFPGMMASFLTQIVASQSTGSIEEEYHILHDLFLMRSGWTTKSCLSLIDPFMGDFTKSVLLLHDFDECNPEGRMQFLDFYTEFSQMTECQFRIVITSRRPNALLPELDDRWAKLDVGAPVPLAASDIDNSSDELTELFLFEDEKLHIRRQIDNLAPMGPTSLSMTLKLLKTHTGLGRDPTTQSQSQFIRLLDLISPSDTIKVVLDKILRSNTDLDGLRWALGWILCGYRPLTLLELIAITLQGRHCHKIEKETASRLNSLALESIKLTRDQLESWLRVLVNFSHDQVILRGELWDLLKDDTNTDNFIWNEVQQSAHEPIVEFCLSYLKHPTMLETLTSMFRKYECQIHEQQIVPPIVPDGEEIVFYVVPALSYHLSKCSPAYRAIAVRSLLADSTAQFSTMWAKFYWAMSDPYSRAQNAPKSVLPVLAGFGFVSIEEIKRSDQFLLAECLIAAIVNHQTDLVSSLLQEQRALSIYMDVLPAAIQSGDEGLALQVARTVLSHQKWDQSAHPWPKSAIWAATWLNMTEVVEMLLNNGVSPDPQDAPDSSTNLALGRYISPLYMASMLGHAGIVRVLLSRGARRDVRRNNLFGCFGAAASSGDVDAVLAFVEEDRSYLDLREPSTGVYIATDWGNWKVVKALLERGAKACEPQGALHTEYRDWTPLLMACCRLYTKTMELLLAHGADVNRLNPYGSDTPLWYVAYLTPSAECVRTLIHGGADPNHQSFAPPLLQEVVRSNRDPGLLIEVCDALIAGERPIDVNASSESGKTALMIASEMGNLALVRWLLEHGANIDALESSGMSALYFAVSASKDAVVEELLKRRAKVDVINIHGGWTLLHAALSMPSILRLLLEAGADASLTDSSKRTPLHLATLLDHTEAVTLLLENNKSDPNKIDEYGWTAIGEAVAYVRSASLTRLLADAGAKLDITIDGRSLLHHALDGSPEVLKVLLEFRKGIDIDVVNNDNATPLIVAATWSKIEHLQILIRAGADLDERDTSGHTALIKAVEAESPECLALLLAEPNIEVNYIVPGHGGPLHIACRSANVTNVRNLLDHGADVHITASYHFPGYPLMAALLPYDSVTRSEQGAMMDEIVRTLVFKGANVQQTLHGNQFFSALSAACLGAGLGALNFLIDEGASVQMADPVSGRLPLHFAAANGIENFRAILLSYRGDMMVADRENKNCLHWAAQFGNAKTVELILSKLGDRSRSYINVPDSDGWTPLCWAVRRWDSGMCEGMRSETRDFVAVVRTLLQHGADRGMKGNLESGTNTEAFTPLDLARRCDADQDIIDMLRYGLDERRESEVHEPKEEDERPIQRYVLQKYCCEICFSQIFGHVYTCASCPSYCVCHKCILHIKTFHSPDILGDEQEHVLKRNLGIDEYIDAPLPLDTDSNANEDVIHDDISNGRNATNEKGDEEGVGDGIDLDDDDLDDIAFSINEA